MLEDVSVSRGMGELDQSQAEAGRLVVGVRWTHLIVSMHALHSIHTLQTSTHYLLFLLICAFAGRLSSSPTWASLARASGLASH